MGDIVMTFYLKNPSPQLEAKFQMFLSGIQGQKGVTVVDEVAELWKKLDWPMAVLEMPLRVESFVERHGIHRLGTLVQHTEAEVLRLFDNSRKSLKVMVDFLASLDLKLGMETYGWRQEIVSI